VYLAVGFYVTESRLFSPKEIIESNKMLMLQIHEETICPFSGEFKTPINSANQFVSSQIKNIQEVNRIPGTENPPQLVTHTPSAHHTHSHTHNNTFKNQRWKTSSIMFFKIASTK
jgi:hypothetical protein